MKEVRLSIVQDIYETAVEDLDNRSYETHLRHNYEHAGGRKARFAIVTEAPPVLVGEAFAEARASVLSDHEEHERSDITDYRHAVRTPTCVDGMGQSFIYY